MLCNLEPSFFFFFFKVYSSERVTVTGEMEGEIFHPPVHAPDGYPGQGYQETRTERLVTGSGLVHP